MVTVRAAVPGEGLRIAQLCALALGGTDGYGPLGEAIDRFGGRLQVPYGAAHLWVAGDTPAAGVIYACPPVRLIEEYAALGPQAQEALGQQLAEIELLTVDAGARRQGVGTALITKMERHLAQVGCRVVLAKIRADDAPVIRWYRQRDYAIAEPLQPVVLAIAGARLECDDGGDGYRLAVKTIRAAGASRPAGHRQ